MKVSFKYLLNYINLPNNIAELQNLMEDIGLEVKRIDFLEDDTLFTLELLANRGDHHSYVGIAREIHGRTGWNLRLPHMICAEQFRNLNLVEVKTDKCLNYVLTEIIKGPHSSELSTDNKQMIELSGINLITPAVDISNFVNLEIGQPLHAFDADRIIGKIQVREAGYGEKAQLLFSTDMNEVPEGTIVIADDEKILAIAGVMGCETSKPTKDTTRIYLESATFDPVRVRKAAKYFGIQSQSSIRFERGADPSLAIDGTIRALDLFNEIGWHSTAQVSVEKKWDFVKPDLILNLSDVNAYFEASIPFNKMLEILIRYGFKVVKTDDNIENIYSVAIPPHRIWDIQNVKDIYEEIARGISYKSLPSSLPSNVRAVQPQENLIKKVKVENLLIGQGFYEVFTDGFYSDTHRAKTRITTESTLWKHVGIINAGDKAYALLKNNTLVQAMELIVTNLNVKNSNIKAFEWTRIFTPNKSSENGLCDEELVLAIVAFGKAETPNWNTRSKDIDVFYLKGLVEEIANLLNLELDIKPIENNSELEGVSELLHTARRASITCQGKPVGILGEVHPEVCFSWGVKSGRPYFLQLSQEIFEKVPNERVYIHPSNLQVVIRDICLLLPKGLEAGEIIAFFEMNSTWISKVEIEDVYSSDSTRGRNAITFSLNFSLALANKNNFTGEEINQETERLVSLALLKYQNFEIERR